LDEPTNHLDIASREALEASLNDYPGTLVMVSHDRQLIDNLVTKLVVMEHGVVKVFLGNYTDFRWKTGAKGAPEMPKSADEVLRIRRGNGRDREKQKKDAKEQRRQKKQLQEVEGQITQMEEMVEALEAQFGQVDPSDFSRTANLKQEYDGLKSDLKALYAEWERLAEEAAE
jgi:ATP-binding cassette subfamily F protein 3